MIERHRAHHIGPARERDDTDPVVRPGFDEFARHFPDRVDAGGRFSTDREIFREHRSRDIEREDDVDSARLDLGETLA